VVVGRGHAVVCPYPGGPQSLNRESQAGTAYRLECGWVGGGAKRDKERRYLAQRRRDAEVSDIPRNTRKNTKGERIRRRWEAMA